MSIGINSQTTNLNTIQPKVQTTFRAQTVPVQNYPPDTVEINGKKKTGMSKSAKIWTGIGTGLATICVTAIAFSKHQTNKLQKLYKEKLVPKIFDKQITFTEAKTKEEALKYAKEILGVQKIDEKMTLDAINYANRGITDVVNKNIGQEIFIPRSYFYDNLGDNTLAHVVRTVESKRFGELGINKNLFDNEWLTKNLDDRYCLRDFAPKGKKQSTMQSTKTPKKVGIFRNELLSSRAYSLYEKYVRNAKNLTVNEKRILYYSYKWENHICGTDWLEFVKKNSNKIKIDVKKLEGLSRPKQYLEIDKYLKEKGIAIEHKFERPYDDGRTVIWHEMGHLQDYANNLKEKHINYWKIFSKDAALETLDNRWGQIGKKGMQELLDKNPKKFKLLYPDLYEFLTNKKIQQTAEKISEYSKSGIGEFIAETYKEMIAGNKIPDEVMALYKKYNGPLPNGFK